MTNPRTLSIALIATMAALALPAAAAAEYLVPEGNSAVKQYTEGFPTAGGEKKTEGNKKAVTAAQAIGAGNAKKLEDHSADGAAVAEVAAETAPAPVPSTGSGENEGQPVQHEDGSGNKPESAKPHKDDGASKQDQSGGGAANGSGDGPSGSSGLGEIVGAATGSSSGGIGPLLPLTLLAAIAWAFAFLWRQRRHPALAAGEKP